MQHTTSPETLALIGGGPAALFMLKHILKAEIKLRKIFIFEKNDRLGVGMPYGKSGAEQEHVANVSANELPELLENFETYIARYPTDDYGNFCKDGAVNPYEVIPRRLLGDYLEFEFINYIGKAKAAGIEVEINLQTPVLDIIQDGYSYSILTDGEKIHTDAVILCIGHAWPHKFEGKVKGWYDSPYPPAKLSQKTNFPVAVRGASLTAVDAIKTLARANGSFTENKNNELDYELNEDSPNFRIDLYSLRGFLPALRFHSEDEAYSTAWTMTLDEIYDYKKSHGGFVDLDYVFERNFKLPLKERDPEFYEKIKSLSIEDFAEKMLEIRKELDSFLLFRAEAAEAEKSIKRHQSVAWKEALTAFSYAVNYPAKHFSAEDMLRLKKTLMPLISIIIAALPQSSYRELMALHNMGLLSSFEVGEDSEITPDGDAGAIYKIIHDDGSTEEKKYEMFVDAIGQKAMLFNDLPFDGLKKGEISAGYLYFKDKNDAEKLLEEGEKNIEKDSSDNFYLKVPGLAINDYFQALDFFAVPNPTLFVMAVPYIGGLNPDYSGLDFCDTAGERIAKKLKTVV